jgi:hypothetical protein
VNYNSGPIVPYKIKQSEFAMIKYIERNLLGTQLWFDWIVLKAMMLSCTAIVVERTGVTARRAHHMIWNAFVATIEGDTRSPVMHEVQMIVHSIPSDLRPIFIARTMIAADIHKGSSEKKAEGKFQEWLHQDDNAIFGDVRLLPSFSTEPIVSGK